MNWMMSTREGGPQNTLASSKHFGIPAPLGARRGALTDHCAFWGAGFCGSTDSKRKGSFRRNHALNGGGAKTTMSP
jgi:hypothetical protein